MIGAATGRREHHPHRQDSRITPPAIDKEPIEKCSKARSNSPLGPSSREKTPP
jgi:hypothetical protein